MSGIGEARIRVPDRVTRGELIVVNAIVSHPMDTGFFRDADGKPIPAYFIKDVVVTYGDQEVARFIWTSGISRDPVVSFTLRADREAPLTMIWTDNKGGVFKQSADITLRVGLIPTIVPLFASPLLALAPPCPAGISPCASSRPASTPSWATPGEA